MPLPWVRLDSNVGQHDKILALKHDPSPKKWQAMSSYFVALGWSGGQGTDGFIPTHALESVHGTAATARLLVKHGLWTERVSGYQIHNYADRQQLNAVTEAKRSAQSIGAKKANCKRFHPAVCECWKESA